MTDAWGAPAPRAKRAAQATPAPLVFPKPTTELWTDHFQVMEVTPGGRVVQLSGSRVNYVDLRSRIIIKRASTTPSTIKVRGDDAQFKDHFGVKVFVNYDDGSRGRACHYVVPIPGLSKLAAKPTKNLARCKPMPTTFNEDNEIKPGDTFEIDTSTLVHNDLVDLKLMGRYIDERPSIQTAQCATTATVVEGEEVPKGTKDRRVCPSAVVPVESRQEQSIQIIVKDYQATVPHEHMGPDEWTERVTRGERFDIDNDLVVSRDPRGVRVQARTRDQVEDLLVEATAKKGDAAPRTVSCPRTLYGPTCSSFEDGEEVTIVVSRPLVIDGQPTHEEVARFELEAAALGLHWAPAGNRRAYYSTASVLAVEWSNDQSPRPTFAQTFAYSLYWKHRKKRWIEAFSVGAHLAILGNTRDGEDEAMATMEPDDEGLVSLGFGGQLGFGWDALQVGAGYDVLTQRQYFLIGIGVPDAIKAVERFRRRK